MPACAFPAVRYGTPRISALLALWRYLTRLGKDAILKYIGRWPIYQIAVCSGMPVCILGYCLTGFFRWTNSVGAGPACCSYRNFMMHGGYSE